MVVGDGVGGGHSGGACGSDGNHYGVGGWGGKAGGYKWLWVSCGRG